MRKRKVAERKFAAFKTEAPLGSLEENDLKKVKDQIIKELAESESKKNEWYDQEFEKNLKSVK